jgi:hypothetical protein
LKLTACLAVSHRSSAKDTTSRETAARVRSLLSLASPATQLPVLMPHLVLDLCTSMCCGPCAAAQLLIEAKKRGPLQSKIFGDGTEVYLNTCNVQWSSILIMSQLGFSQQWRHGTFGCFENVGNCCYVWCCPFCALAQTRTNYDESDCCFNFLCVSTVRLYFVSP